MEMSFITPDGALACPELFRSFTVKDAVLAELRITGLGLYRAELNGRRVGRDYLTPGFNDYDAYLRYQTYDVTELLREDGQNILSVTLGSGWYSGRIGFRPRKGHGVWGEKPLLACRLTVTHTDGSVTELETDETWQARASAITFSNIYDGEHRDDTLAPGAPIPCVRVETAYRLEEPVSPPIRAVAELKPTLIITPKGEQVLDFGQNAAGVFRFVNRTPRGTAVRIQTGEVLQQGNFYRDNLRSALSEYRYVSDGEEKEIEPRFTFFGFRYLKVEGIERVDPEDFTMVVLSSDLRQTLRAETDHPGLNQLMRNTLWGQRSNFLDVPTDCPQRDERLGWTADTQVFVNTACYQMDCKAFYRKYMKDLRADQTMYLHGDLPQYSPSLKGEGGSGGAVWADAGTIVPWNVYMNYGDRELLAESYPMMRDYADFLIARDEKDGGTHLLFPYFTFGDWLARDGLTDQSVFGGTENAWIQGVYYMRSVQLTAMAARELGLKEDAARFEKQYGAIRAALLDEYVTPNGRLAVDTQTAYVLALCYGVYRDRDKLIEGFRRRLHRDSYKLTCGFTGAPLLLSALLDAGLKEEAYRMLLSEEFPGWLYEVKLGATTVWERWNSLDGQGNITGISMNSLNHYAYGSVCETVYSRVMGLRVAAPGWKKALIAPQLTGDLRRSDIGYASAAGTWEVSWRIGDDGSVSLSCLVPEGASARVVLPDHPEGLQPEVQAGRHSWHYHPTADYLHPWSLKSRLLDLVKVPAALEVLRRYAPDTARNALAGDRELLLKTVEEACGRDCDRLPLQAGLRAVSR